LGSVGYRPGEFRHLDAYHNVVIGFQIWYVSLFYVAAMLALGLHLWHGTWSMFQTLGVMSPRWDRTVQAAGAVLAARGGGREGVGAAGRDGRLAPVAARGQHGNPAGRPRLSGTVGPSRAEVGEPAVRDEADQPGQPAPAHHPGRRHRPGRQRRRRLPRGA